MGKFFTILIISVCSASSCFALGLELSDVIKEAREIEKAKLSQNQTQETPIQSIKNNHYNKNISNKQNTCEKK